MKLHFPNSVFQLEDILNGKINQKKFSQSESYIFNFIKQWHSDKAYFHFNTSGSTGVPKTIKLSRQQLIYSALSTLKYLFDERPIGRMALCINPEFIGGSQVIIRAMLSNSDLIFIPAAAQALNEIERPIGLISMVPIQVYTELKNPHPFLGIDTVLIGGANIDANAEMTLAKLSKTNFYHTFGMTETASHIALRKLGTPFYKPIGDVQLKLDNRECLQINGSVTNHQWITTNDMVELSDEGFIWKGRADWVINSGGIKIHPEQVEQKLRNHFPDVQLMIASIPDDRLNNKVVLISTRPILEQIKIANILDVYEVPKEEFLIEKWPETASGKLDRLAVNNWVKNNGRHSL